MSFKCGSCRKPQPNGVSPNKTVVETRPKTYTKTFVDRNGEEEEVEIGFGYETVKELDLCDECKPEDE